ARARAHGARRPGPIGSPACVSALARRAMPRPAATSSRSAGFPRGALHPLPGMRRRLHQRARRPLLAAQRCRSIPALVGSAAGRGAEIPSLSGAAEAPSSPSADRRTSSSADRRKRPRRIAPLLAGAGLAAVFALSLLARWPVHGGLPPGEDKALNARYLAALRAGEALPARDPMMIAPTGRVLAEHFPLGLYRVMKGWTALAPASDAE